MLNTFSSDVLQVRTLFIIDILYMKDINAVYGYENGDYIILQTFNILKTKISEDIITFFSQKNIPNSFIDVTNPYADIFHLTISDDLDTEILKLISEIIISKLTTNPFELKDHTSHINIEFTIGCSKSSDKNLKIYAEKALQVAKLTFTHYAYFDPIFYKHELPDASIIHILRYNISHNKVIPYFQSIIDNETNTIHKYEALIRLQTEDGGILFPDSFLKKSQKYRLYPKLMSLMIENVLTKVREHKIHTSLNLGYNDMINPMIKETLLGYLDQFDIGKFITIEILESEKISDFNVVRDFIKTVKKYGVKVAIDDFGSGFSNYEHILELNVDYVKLDGSLIQKIDESIYYNLVKSIVSFCKKEGIKVVAEFVKDITILRYVKSLEIDYSQGYYLSKPEPIERILKDLN